MRKYLRILIIALFFFYQFGLNNILMVLASSLKIAFALSASSMGWLGSLYFWGDIVFLLPAGWLVDQWGARKMVLGVMSLSVILVFISALFPNLYIFALTRILEGACGSFGLIGALKLGTFYIEKEKITVMSGLVTTLGMMGSFTMALPLTWVIACSNWQGALHVVGVVGIVILVLLIWVTQKKPGVREDIPEYITFKNMLRILLKPQVLLNAVYVCLMNLPIYIWASLWGVPMLMEILHIPQTLAAMITSLLFIGNMLSAPLLGFLADHYQRRKILMYSNVFLALIFFVILLSTGMQQFALVVVLFFLIGVTTSAQILAFAVVIEQNPHYLSGSATSVVAMLSALGGALGQPLFGMLLSHWVNLGVSMNIAYIKVSVVFIGALLLALVSAWRIKSP